jgi:type IV secretory pathway VirB4 component
MTTDSSSFALPHTTLTHNNDDFVSTMFLPSAVQENKKKEKDRKAAFKNIEAWSLEIIPEAIRGEAQVSIQEVQCGDPMCAPIDTAVTIQFSRYEFYVVSTCETFQSRVIIWSFDSFPSVDVSCRVLAFFSRPY